MKPLVTVITPSYNQGQFIQATIESVLSQDYPNIEYIIMDGASTDHTAEVVKPYADRLTWISEKDRGQSDAINKGFRIAKGSIVAWLNSDDIYLPGAVSTAVKAFEEHPRTGAIYGEGFQIDKEGKVKSKFPFTEPFNLWKLTHSLDYILQQTVFFRRDAIHEVGLLDESLHYGMDWDILVRLGKRFGLTYIPVEMGAIREYDDAKSFTGGAKRFDELGQLIRRQSERRFPPAYTFYGLDTYEKIWCPMVKRCLPGPFGEVAARRLSQVCRMLIDRAYAYSGGLYRDGWASNVLHYMIPEGKGKLLFRGENIQMSNRLAGQTIVVEAQGLELGRISPDWGPFEVEFNVPGHLQGKCLTLKLTASRSVVPSKLGSSTDTRTLAYRFGDLRWTERVR